jgi:hypothetical protein
MFKNFKYLCGRLRAAAALQSSAAASYVTGALLNVSGGR